MSVGWVAGAVRGRALARRRLGDEGIATLASRQSLGDALEYLAASSYGHRVRRDLDVASARRAVGTTSLWHLRVLSGWLPPSGVPGVRAIAGWFELENITSRTVALAGGSWDESPHTLGALATVWPSVQDANTLPQLRTLLAHSTWGDPGGDGLADILLGLQVGWARRLRAIFPPAREWGDGALALAVAKASFVPSGTRSDAIPNAVPELGGRWREAANVEAFANALPASGRWVFADVGSPEDLWRAERQWWTRVDADAAALVDHPSLGQTVVLAAAMLLVTDCWRTQAALERAARSSLVEEGNDGEA